MSILAIKNMPSIGGAPSGLKDGFRMMEDKTDGASASDDESLLN